MCQSVLLNMESKPNSLHVKQPKISDMIAPPNSISFREAGVCLEAALRLELSAAPAATPSQKTAPQRRQRADKHC
jgi:hypothetical protein